MSLESGFVNINQTDLVILNLKQVVSSRFQANFQDVPAIFPGRFRDVLARFLTNSRDISALFLVSFRLSPASFRAVG